MSNAETHEPAVPDELASELEAFKGRWVAIVSDKVVADGNSAAEVFKLALDRGHTDPLVFRVSDTPERLAFF